MFPKILLFGAIVPLFLSFMLKPSKTDLLPFKDAAISFDTSYYQVQEGGAITICLGISDYVDTLTYQARVEFKTSAIPHFAGSRSKIINFQQNEYCFDINPKDYTQDTSIYFYQLQVIPTSGNLDDGVHTLVTIEVTDKSKQYTALAANSLLFVGYDNAIDTFGSDRLAITNMVPLQTGTKFYIANTIYDENIKRWLPNGRDSISFLGIEYIGNDVIPLVSEIQFTILNDTNALQRLINFTLNGVATSDFQQFQTAHQSYSPIVNLDTVGTSQLYIVNGTFQGSDSGFLLQGNPITVITLKESSDPNPDVPINIKDGAPILPHDDGSTYGFYICTDSFYLCDLTGFVSDSINWIVRDGSKNNDIPGWIIEQNGSCDYITCQDGEIVIEPQCNSGCSDYIFLIDNSSTVNKSTEYPAMKASIVNTMYEILNAGIDARFAVAQFTGTDIFDLTIPFTNNFAVASDFTYAFALGSTDVGSAVMNVIDLIDNDTSFTLRGGCQLHLLLYNDAMYLNYMQDSGYDPYNFIKQEPYNAVISNIRYQGDFDLQSNPIAASTASVGGSYYGSLGSNGYENVNDPDGQSKPRRLYIAEEFSDPLFDLIDDVSDCEILLAQIDAPCDNPEYEWTASEGGEIFVNNGASITTNEQGLFELEVLCSNECIYSGSYEYDTTSQSLKINPVTFNPKVSEYSEDQEWVKPPSDDKDSVYLQIHAFPNPNRGSFTLTILSGYDQNVLLSLYSLDGKIVTISEVTIDKGESNISFIQDIPPGIYYLICQGKHERQTTKITIIH